LISLFCAHLVVGFPGLSAQLESDRARPAVTLCVRFEPTSLSHATLWENFRVDTLTMDQRTIMTRAKSGALPRPSAATSGDSEEDGRQSDSELGGYTVDEPDGVSPNESESDSGGDGSCAQTVDSRAVRLPSGLRVLFSQLLFCLVHVT
jgi:hypothetical protein